MNPSLSPMLSDDGHPRATREDPGAPADFSGFSNRSVGGKTVVVVAFLGCFLAAVFAIVTRGSFATSAPPPSLGAGVVRVPNAKIPAPRFFLPSSSGPSRSGPVLSGSVAILGFFDGCDTVCTRDIAALAKATPAGAINIAMVDTSDEPPSSSQLVASLVGARLPSATRRWVEYGGDSSASLGIVRQYRSLTHLSSINDVVFCIDGRGYVRLWTGGLNASVLHECVLLANSPR